MTSISGKSTHAINHSDILYARVTFMGQQLFNMRIQDMCSLSQVVNWVRNQLNGFTGLVKITLRNASQGWTSDYWYTLTPTTQCAAAV